MDFSVVEDGELNYFIVVMGWGVLLSSFCHITDQIVLNLLPPGIKQQP